MAIDPQTWKNKIESAREKVALVWNEMATDDTPDNGNLSELNSTVLLLNNVLKYIDKIIEDG